MSYEIPELCQVALGARRLFEYEITDTLGGTFELESVTFAVRDADGNVVASGSGTVNNDDRNAAGAAVQTVAMEVDFGDTDFDAGHYQITFTVSFVPRTTDESGDVDKFAEKIEVVNYDAVL